MIESTLAHGKKDYQKFYTIPAYRMFEECIWIATTMDIQFFYKCVIYHFGYYQIFINTKSKSSTKHIKSQRFSQ